GERVRAQGGGDGRRQARARHPIHPRRTRGPRRSRRRQAPAAQPQEGPGRAMIEKLRTIFQVPELRRRILFTHALFVVYRLGEHMPTPGVDAAALAGAVLGPATPRVRVLATLWAGAATRAPDRPLEQRGRNVYAD